MVQSFLWTQSSKENLIFEKRLPIFKTNSPSEDNVTEKLKVEALELIFHIVSKNSVISDLALYQK